MYDFDGRVALVTGAASGIGRSTALAFAAEGARVVVSDVQEKKGEEVAEEIRSSGGEAIFLACDVSSSREVDSMVGRTVERYSRLDFAFNNAGTEGTMASTVDYPEESWRRVIEINLIGVWLCMKRELEVMLPERRGSIVNMSSILGQVSLPNASAYCASKHGVLGLSKASALEYAASGIRINAVCPGFIDTPMVMERGLEAGRHPEILEDIVRREPMGRLGRPEEIAAAVLWLCSDHAAFVTGHSLLVDGGYVAR